MNRRLLNLLTALSLLVCVAVVALWVRGYGVSDEVCWVKGRYTYALRSYLGGFQASRSWAGLFGKSGYFRTTVHGEPLPGDPDSDGIMDFPPYWSDQYFGAHCTWEWGGFAAAEGQEPIFGLRIGPADPDEGRFAVVVVPCWFAAAAAALLPAVRLSGAVRRARRRRRHVCVVCGYDLRATPGRCPECGHTPAQAT